MHFQIRTFNSQSADWELICFLPGPPTLQPRAGVDHGPSHLIQDGLIKNIESVGYSTVLVELNLSTILKKDNLLKTPRLVSKTKKTLMKIIDSHTANGEFVVTIGGDHSLAIGTLSGTLNAFPEACVIWVDAHADINTPKTTESGNMHGCPVSFVLSTSKAGTYLEPFQWIKPCLQPDQLVYISLRDINMGKRKILKDHNIRCFMMHDVDRHEIGKVVEMC
ncbi:hypothetical protein PtA15_16A363 [Puccinia triticina]|uniref:Arginase n=1 Tax=Puccinia triticina TaxID=208348 RepID=A0ABY7D5E0_9BASI|nr:uncharacterized protein PtA15_16A363 [Puccinia triticina]WAQ92455.1 hypothetical protein PtA15_16A363 [Puccinia triticina]